MAFKFEKLIVWQKSLDLSEAVDTLTKNFQKKNYIFSLRKLSGPPILFH